MTLSLPSFTRFLVRAVPLLVLLVGASLLTQAQTTRYVKPAASGSGNGSSWANASGNLQAMINASVATDQVWVAAGTYKPTTTTDRAISFSMKDGVAIYGGFAGTETALSQRPAINLTTPSSSILSGDLGTPGIIADNSYHVISNPTTLINMAVLDGFIITGGNANGGSSAGGGMFNPGIQGGTGASPTVRNCSFQGNSASIGGAVYIYNAGSNGNSTFTNCSFRGNSATTSGGAIFNYKYSGSNQVMLTNCSFQGNSAATAGGAIFNVGETFTARPVLTNCSFQNNSASQGGAFYNDGAGVGGNSQPKLNNCVLFGNGGSNAIRNSSNSNLEATCSLFEAGAVFTPAFTTDVFYNVGGVTVNPFTSTSSVALNACAPAIDRGYDFSYTNSNGPSTDLAGNNRFYGGRIDMGAVEFQGAPSTITVSPPSTNTVTVGTAYNQTFSPSGGSSSYSLLSGSLPPGITLATSGVLSGIPTQVGRFSFTVRVMDQVTGCWGEGNCTLWVRSGRPIRYVKAGGTGNGDSWANASGDLQSQIDLLGTEKVWVAAGTYKPTTGTDRTISFAMRPGVEIYGGFVGNETSLGARPAINPVKGNPSATILSGDIGVVGNNSDNSYHVILNRDGLGSTDILDGFVITGGNANDVYSSEGGGGMANICRRPAGVMSPTVRNCLFQGNAASHGGAIYNDASPGGSSSDPQNCSPILINCVFRDNSARAGGAVSNNASGNAFFCSPQFDNCHFINNTAVNGGAMENYSNNSGASHFRLTNCLFQNNTADIAGGAINHSADAGGYSYPELINCSFQGNSIKQDTRDIGRLGGAIYLSASGGSINAKLTNCSFQANTAANLGGAIYAYSQARQGFLYSFCDLTLLSCVVFGNGGNKTFAAGSTGGQYVFDIIRVRNSLIESSATNYYPEGSLNTITTSTSPFASPDSPALAANSPAVNAGYSSVQRTDVAGNPRIVGCRIDMGAYELQYDPTVAITAQPTASSVVCGRASVSVPVGVSGQYLTYQWYKDSFANPVTGQTSATLTLANVQPANAGSYSLVVTGSCNSLTSTAFTLTVNQPTVSVSPGSATICQGKSVLLTANGASTYTWSNTTTGNTLTATTAGTYSVTGVDGNGCTNSVTAIVTENKPTVSISPVSATICPGKSVLLTASGASTGETLSYTWSNNTTDNTLTATTAGTYSVTGVDGNGCTNTATATITENKPTVSISPNPASICQASSVLLTASGASTYTWSNNTTSNTLSATTMGTYSVTGVAANGCFNSATATVTDNRSIVSITASPSATVVQGASITLTASGTGATSFAWSSGSTSNSTVINPATSAPYSVTVRNAAGCVTVASLSITVTPISCGPVIYVTQTGSGQRDGSSWANALGSSQLQSGISAAAGCGGDRQVWVAAGTYKPTTDNDRSASFALRNGVSVYGGFVGNETALTDRPAYNPVADRPSSTTLSGDIGTVGSTSDNSFRVINNPASLSLTTTAVLDGFVITGGAGGTLGGGMFNDGSSPTLRNCSFVGNSVSASGSTISRGGAIYNGNSSSPQFYNCYFLTNSAFSSAGVNGFGGAMANLNSSNPQLTNCNFVNNRVSGSAQNQGGAVANNLNSSPQLINCSFLSNSASGSTVNRGGAVANANGSSPQLINCSFLSNSVSGATSSTSNQGGAVYNNVCTPQLTNCVLFGNGGANTFYNATGGSVVVAYSSLETTVTSFTAGTGNLTTDVSPFVSATDTRLNGCSPAVNTGDNSVNSTTTDPDGNPRVYQNGRIDMGAYEYQGAAGVAITNPTMNTATVGVAFSQNFTASGGTSPYSYSLASGSLPPGLSLSNTGVLSGTPTQTGSFTITVSATNASSCLGVSAPYVLTVIDAASPNPTLAGFAASSGAVCAGSVVSFTATVGNVTGSYNYTLSNGPGASLTGSTSGSPFSQSITAIGTGTQNFTLTVSANGQSASSVTALAVNPSPVASLINNGPLSCAQSSVTLTASGGSSYTFANGSGVLGTPGPISTLVVSTSGTYSVSVASASGCVSTTSTVVTADQSVPAVSITSSSTTLSCASPSVSLTAVGSGPVRWSTGETTSVISVSVAGPYSVTATGSNGCSSVASVSVSQDNTAPVASIISSGSLSCAVTSVTLTASPSGQSYVFSGPGVISQSGNTAVVNASGTYSVTVVSANGCSAVASTSVSQDNAVSTASLVSNGSLTCSVTSVTLTASPAGQSYVFSGPGVVSSSGNTAVVNASGLYSVTVISANGCSSVASTSVSQDNTAPVASLVSSGSLTCSVISVTLTAGPGGQRYIFSNGASQIGTSNQAVVNTSGTYSVTVISGNSCSSVASVSVGQDQTSRGGSLVSSGSLSCSATSVTLTASPNGQSYSFSGPSVISQSGNTAVVNASGPYSVTVVSANGCSSVASTSVSQDNTVPVASLVSSGSLTCSVTSVTLTANPAGQSYTFSGPGVISSTGNTAVVNLSGLYSVTVVSANGCSSVASVSVGQDNTAPMASLVSSGSLTCSVTSVTLTAGPGGQRYVFSNGASQSGSSPTATVSQAGLYSVTVIATNGCTATTQTTVDELIEILLAFVQPPASASTVAPGASITTTVSVSGSGPLTYQWYKDSGSNPLTGQTRATLSLTNVQMADAGSYSVVVTGACRSLTSTAFVLTVSPAPVVNTAPTLANAVSSQTATVGQSYSLDLANTFTDQQTPNSLTLSASGLPAGLSLVGTTLSGTPSVSGVSPIIITATDPGSLSASTSFVLTVSPAPPTRTALRVLHRDVDNYADNNAVQPMLQILNEGTGSLPLSSITLRYYLTVEGATPLSVLSINYAQVGDRNVSLRYVPLNPARQGASGYVEYRFTPDAGSLAPGTNSGNIQSYFAKADYSALNELDDYSYAPVRDQLVANPRITAYADGVLIWGQEPGTGAVPCPPISLTASNGGRLSCSQPSLILTASGGQTYVFSQGTTPVSANQVSVSSEGVYSVTATSANGCVEVGSVRVAAPATLPTPDFVARGNAAIADGLTSVSVAQNSPPVRFGATSCSGTLEWSGNGLSGTGLLEAPTASPGVFVYQATCRVGSCVSGPASVTVSVTGTPANQPPVAVANASQVATVGVPFSYTVNAFTDERLAGLVYSASLVPANGLTFDPATRVISGTPSVSGVSTVTVTATDPGSLSASTSFTITVSPAPPTRTALRVLHRDVDNYADNNAVQPMLQLLNEGTGSLPLSTITLRYYLTVESPSTLSNLQIFFAQVGDRNVQLRYVPLEPARQGASGYVEYRFTPDAGSLAPGANSGNIQSYFAKADYSALNELDDYSYAPVRDQLVANPRITAYADGVLIWGQEPGTGARQGVAEPGSPLTVTLLGNPVRDEEVVFVVTGASGQPLQLRLVDAQGRVLSQQQVPSAEATQRHQLSLSGQAGSLFLLQVSTPTQTQTVKVTKAN